jgi:hypothetical protein
MAGGFFRDRLKALVCFLYRGRSRYLRSSAGRTHLGLLRIFLLLSMKFPLLFFVLSAVGLFAKPPFALPEPVSGANGTELRLFAKEPFLRNTVAVAVGEDGRVYATSVLRRKAADLDIRQFRDWVEKDLSLRTVEEKRAFLRSELTAENSKRHGKVKDQNEDGVIDWRDLTVLTDRILVLEDSDGDGVADRSETFAEGFNTEVTGIAAGLEVWDGTVYATALAVLSLSVRYHYLPIYQR